jgi:hypothetical protein
MISNNEHFFIYLLTIYMSYLEKCLFKSFAHFLKEKEKKKEEKKT